MDIRAALPRDHAGILDLQAANYSPNLTAAERAGGFLSAEFTPLQIAAIAQDIGILVAEDAGALAGYLCAHRADMAPLPGVVEAMLRCVRAARYGERELGGARLFVYGPVCVARAWRGRGVLRALFGALCARMARRFEYGVTLVAAQNPHSLRAHTDGLGMRDVGCFEHHGHAYRVLAFEVPLR